MPSVAGRLGQVECFNLDLLTKLTKRPKTIVNPPRMRNDTETETIGGWYEGPGRMRRDALAYAAPEIAAELRARVRLPADAAPANLFEETTPGDRESTAGDWAAEGEVRLAAAE
jgi:DNA (cytosine-5)-methyltransferase 1